MHAASKVIQRAAGIFGLEIRRATRGSSPMSQHLHRLLKQLETDLVIDVGGNRGQFVRLLRTDVGYAGKVVSFEPLTDAFGAMSQDRDGDLNWQGRREAVGTRTGKQEINVFSQDNFSSFLPPNEYGADRWNTLRTVKRTETVDVRRLDEVWPEVTGAATSVFLKIDTQGRDLDVLESAGSALSEVRGLLTEVPVQRIYEGQPTFIRTMEALLDLGFDIAGMWPETHDAQLRVVEFNCLLRRRA